MDRPLFTLKFVSVLDMDKLSHVNPQQQKATGFDQHLHVEGTAVA